jgi:hypothetical protein
MEATMPDPRWTRVHLEADKREPFAPSLPRRATDFADQHPVSLPLLAGVIVGMFVMLGIAGTAS